MSDIDVIKQIEEELGVELSELDEIKWNSRGYALNQNRWVTGLNLYECRIQNLNGIISLLEALPNLRQLDLNFTRIRDISPLKALPNLTELNLSGNELGDIFTLIDILREAEVNTTPPLSDQ